MGLGPLHLRRVPRVRHHRPLLRWRALADGRAVPQEHHALVCLPVDPVGRRGTGRRAGNGGAWPGPDHRSACSAARLSNRGQRVGAVAVRHRPARRLRRRLSRLFRLRCDLAELLLLAPRRGEERVASGSGVLHRCLLGRHRHDVQRRATRTQRDSRHRLTERSSEAPMILKHSLLACTAALTLLAASSLVQAQTVDTRIGKLELEAGYPSKETAEKLFDEMDFQRATQAYIWALPAVGFQGLHRAHLDTFGAKDGEVVLYQDLKDKAGMLTPNLTTLYLMSFFNLAEQGPMVVEVPAGATAGGFLDVWQRPISDTGQTGPDRGGGGKYLIVPPGSDIQQMKGYIVARSPTNQVWFAARSLNPDHQVAEEVARKHKVYAWKDRDNPPETKFIPVSGKEWA